MTAHVMGDWVVVGIYLLFKLWENNNQYAPNEHIVHWRRKKGVVAGALSPDSSE
jgi:hypothetical protein